MLPTYEPGKSRSRRAEIRKNRPDVTHIDWQKLRTGGIPLSLTIAVGFFLLAALILLMRQEVAPYRPDQPIPHDIVSRVPFTYLDKARLAELQFEAWQRQPRVYRPNPRSWDDLETELLQLPGKVADGSGAIPPDLKDALGSDPGAATALRHASTGEGRDNYDHEISAYIAALRNFPTPLVILRDSDRKEDLQARREIRIGQELIEPGRTYGLGQRAELQTIFKPLAETLPTILQPVVVDYTLAKLTPTAVLDADATERDRNLASSEVPTSAARRHVDADQILVYKSTKHNFDPQDWLLMRAENEAYLAQLPGFAWKSAAGTALLAFIVTAVLCAYVCQFQPRVATNHFRAFAIAALLLAMLLLAQLAGISYGPIYLLGIAPTLLVAMILTIAYEQRFAIGIASMHGLLVTVALGQGAPFFIILWVGTLTASFLLDDIRTRSKLIEVGGATALTMMAAAAAAGLLAYDSPRFILKNCLYTGAAALAVGFIVLGILPFIERAFKITTSMTLLELADPSHPLLRRLGVEAPGTYSHSLQVATLAEEAAEEIGANALLCRVASYYHDIGKLNKPEYFVENQANGANRHMTLTPTMSLTIIKNHVKDGIAMAREYSLPNAVVPFIEQHHGTTLIEYFFHRACTEQERQHPDAPAPADHDFRYDGPKPRSRETAIVMVADAVESATRAMGEPDYSRIERLVHDLAMKRLLDGQFEECDLTTRDLERIERSMVKTLMGMHHGRIQYPASATTVVPPRPAAPPSSAQTA